MALNRRVSQLAMLQRRSLVILGPGRGGMAQEPQRAVDGRAEPEAPALRDDQGIAGSYIHR